MKYLTKYLVLTVFVWSIFSGLPAFAGSNEKLIAAAGKGNIRAVQALIEKGANVNAADMDGDTALVLASGGGYLEIVKLLLDKGADVNVKNKKNEDVTPLLIVAATLADYNVRAQALMNEKHENGTVVLAVQKAPRGYTDVIQVLLDKGADVNAKTKTGWTVLMFAAQGGFPTDIVQTLLSKGADVNAKTNNNKTALMLAEKYGYKEIVELLKKAGAKE